MGGAGFLERVGYLPSDASLNGSLRGSKPEDTIKKGFKPWACTQNCPEL
jgi:hypothetical protein